VVDLFGSRVEDLTIHSPDYEFCGYQQFNMYIGGNQKVYRCCTTAYTRHGEVGDLSDKRLWDWFHSDEKKRAYGEFNATSCFACPYNNKNRVIDYLVSAEPTHIDFV
jgi:MoaA/NifB/PqqE/SkfB family radical SAM enzyme